jgi:hypothetical protein
MMELFATNGHSLALEEKRLGDFTNEMHHNVLS